MSVAIIILGVAALPTVLLIALLYAIYRQLVDTNRMLAIGINRISGLADDGSDPDAPKPKKKRVGSSPVDRD